MSLERLLADFRELIFKKIPIFLKSVIQVMEIPSSITKDKNDNAHKRSLTLKKKLSLILSIADNQKWYDSRGQADSAQWKILAARGHAKTAGDGQSGKVKGIRRKVG